MPTYHVKFKQKKMADGEQWKKQTIMKTPLDSETTRSRPALELPRKGRNSMHKSKTEYD